MAKDRQQFHVTALNTIEFCGEAYRRRYIKGEKIPPGAYAVVGSSVDKSVTRNLENKIVHGSLLPLEEVQSVARDATSFSFENDEVFLEPGEDRKQVAGAAVDKAVRLATLHAKDLAPKIKPTEVQKSFSLKLPGYDFDLVGTMDIVEEESINGMDHRIIRIRDTKTKRANPPKNAADASMQLTGYALAIRVLEGQDPAEVILDHLIDLKAPKISVQVSKRGPEDYQVFLRRLQMAAEAIDKGVFMPAKAGDPLCSERWCGYWSTCQYVSKG